MNEIEKVYEEFWKNIVENLDGTINLDQVKMELYDFKVVMDEVSQAYYELTNDHRLIMSLPMEKYQSPIQHINM